MSIMIPIGLGDLADRWSIVRLKMINMHFRDMNQHKIRAEFKFFNRLMEEQEKTMTKEMRDLAQSIAGVNAMIWDRENFMRKNTGVSDEIINTALRIRDLNDKRAREKRKLNQLGGAEFLDHKVYNQ
jgi:hypothetical protein